VVVILKRYAKPFVLFSLLICTALLLSGCSISSLSTKVFGKKVEATLPAEFVHIDDQEYSKAVTSLIKGAKKCVYVEQFQFDRKDYIDLLVAQAKQGVEVKVLLDNSVKANKATYDYLRANGVSVQYYPTQKGQSARAKLIAVDNTRSIIAGNDWYSAASPNHDVALELDGRAGLWVAKVFSGDWSKATTNNLNVPSQTDLPDDHILLATNDNIKAVLSRQIQDSKKSIQVELTQLADTELITMLSDIAASGKQVQVILDSNWQKTNQFAIDKLKASGASVRNYPTTDTLRQFSRFAVFDGTNTVLGTANWTRSSFVSNHELAAMVPSKAVSEKLATLFKEDWQKSKDAEVTKAKSNATTPDTAAPQK
jgi:cardiolipin synthase A/B